MTYLFIDANVMLHYRRIEEIDWGTLSNSKEVTIVLCPVVVRELDNLKVNHPQKRLRKRAQEIVSSLHAWLSDSDSSSIRQGVWLEFLHNDPDLDFHMHGLRKEISDDWLIASSMVWKQQHPKDDTKIVSADLGVAIKARAKEILVLTPSDGDKLPEEVDEDKKQINELQKELAGIKNTLPVLSLGFWECPDKEFVRFGIKNPFPYDPQASAGEMEHLRSIYQLLTPSNTSPRRRPREIEKLMQSLDPASAFRVTKEGAEQYNSDLTEYFQKYEEYLRKAHDHQNKECLKFDFEIGLHNDGGSPAEDVDIHLDFPDGFELFDGRHHVFKAPDKPEPPKRPGGVNLFATRPFSALENMPFPRPFTPGPPPNVSSPIIERTNSYTVRLHANKAKHGYITRVATLAGVFQTYESAKSFGFDYSISAANLPKAVSGSLSIVVEKGSDQ